MSASRHARRERLELAELMLALGPDAPTLCTGWTTRDLAAHLVIREGRIDAGPGIVLPAFSGWTDRLQRAATTLPYSELIRRVRTGPPTLSVFSIPGMDGLGNLFEYAVHHEDVRRAQPDWAPRELPPGLGDELWGRLRTAARLMYLRVPMGVTLERTDGDGGSVVAHGGEPAVTLRGSAMELLLRSYGRRAVDLEVIGEPADVERFETAAILAI